MIFLLKPPFSAGISWLAMFDYQRASASVQHRNCFRIHTTSTKKTYRQVAQRVLHIANTIHLTKVLLVEDDGSCSRIFSATTNEFTYTQLGWWLSLTLEVFGEAWNTAYPPRNGRFEFGKWWLTAKIEGVSNNFKQTICIHTSYIYTYIYIYIYISYIISLSHYIPPSMYGFSMLFCSGHQAKCSTVFF